MLKFKNQAGIGLIEVLITIVIISGSILALTKLQSQTLLTASYNKQRTEASAYGQQAIEIIRSKMERASCEIDANNLKKLDFIDIAVDCADPTDHSGSHNTMYRSCTATLKCKNNDDGTVSAPNATTGCDMGISVLEVTTQIRWDDNENTPTHDKFITMKAVFPDVRKTKTSTNWIPTKDWGYGEITKQGDHYLMCIKNTGCLIAAGNNKPKTNDTDTTVATAQALNWKLLSLPYCPKI